MKKKVTLFLILIFSCLVVSAQQQNQSSGEDVIIVTGKVIDKLTKDPLPGAIVKVNGKITMVTTDGNGNYTIRIPISELVNGNYTLNFEFAGYTPGTITKAATVVTLNVGLEESLPPDGN